jgi:hypothetical protein
VQGDLDLQESVLIPMKKAPLKKTIVMKDENKIYPKYIILVLKNMLAWNDLKQYQSYTNLVPDKGREATRSSAVALRLGLPSVHLSQHKSLAQRLAENCSKTIPNYTATAE